MTAGSQATVALVRGGPGSWLTSTDHKRVAVLTGGLAVVLFFAMGVLALLMRSQLAVPNAHVLSHQMYNELFTIHGSGMIYLVITPIALAFGVYVVPLQVGAPAIAAPRLTLAGFWLYALGAAALLSGFATTSGAAADGWFSYTPLATSQYSPGHGTDLWILGTTLSTIGMIAQGWAVLWTALRKRAPGVTMLRMPVFTWSMIATCLMIIGAFPALLAAMAMLTIGRVDPSVFASNVWNIGYQHMFWFYGHPVVYVMFFPFIGAVAEVIATFSGRRFVGYPGTVLALLAFAALSMSVWGHHMFATNQASNDYYTLTSTLLLIPAGLEYFGILATLVGGRLRFRTPMLFAIAFIPQFLIGGLTGIMVGTPVIDYHVTDSFFVVAHFHYTLMAGSVFGLFAGFYFWFPKVTGVLLNEKWGKAHFWLLTLGTNLTFLPMFWLGYMGMPRRIATYPASSGFGPLNLVSTCGAGVLAIAMACFAFNVAWSLRVREEAQPNPWRAHTLEWATSSPPPYYNFAAGYPIPRVRSYAPLLDLRERSAVAPTAPARPAAQQAQAHDTEPVTGPVDGPASTGGDVEPPR